MLRLYCVGLKKSNKENLMIIVNDWLDIWVFETDRSKLSKFIARAGRHYRYYCNMGPILISDIKDRMLKRSSYSDKEEKAELPIAVKETVDTGEGQLLYLQSTTNYKDILFEDFNNITVFDDMLTAVDYTDPLSNHLDEIFNQFSGANEVFYNFIKAMVYHYAPSTDFTTIPEIFEGKGAFTLNENEEDKYPKRKTYYIVCQNIDEEIAAICATGIFDRNEKLDESSIVVSLKRVPMDKFVTATPVPPYDVVQKMNLQCHLHKKF